MIGIDTAGALAKCFDIRLFFTKCYNSGFFSHIIIFEGRMKTKQGFLPSERRAISLLASLYGLRMLGLFMVLPVFFVQGANLEGATPQLLGLAIGIYGLSQALLQVPFGMLSDRFGRKPLIVMGLVLFIIGSVIAATSDSVYGVIIGRFLQGSGAIASVLMALLSDLTREEQRTKAMATVGMTIGLSFAVALVIGPLVSVKAGLEGLFWLTAGLAVLGLGLVFQLPRTVSQKRHLDTMMVTSSINQVISNSQLMRLNFGIFALHMMMTALFVAAPKSLVEYFDVSPEYHGYYYLAVIFTGFIAMVPFIIYGEKKRRLTQVFRISVFLLTLAMGFEIWTESSFALYTLFLFLFFLAFNFLEATLPSLVSKVAPAGMRGTAMGVYSSAQFFGAFLGGSLGGVAYAEGGLSMVYGLCTAIGVIWCFVNIRMPEPPYTTSLVLPLRSFAEHQASEISSKLSQVPGVQDVTLVIEDSLAYLKIDRKFLDEDKLMNHPLAAQAKV